MFNQQLHQVSASEYTLIHMWLKQQFGRANKCELCGRTEVPVGKAVYFHWAKLKGKPYARERNNFWMLCFKCHKRYDVTEEYREYCRQRMLGTQRSEETKRRMSLSAKGRPGHPAWNKGVKATIHLPFSYCSVCSIKLRSRRSKTCRSHFWTARKRAVRLIN